jgi:CBS domain-containing protein
MLRATPPTPKNTSQSGTSMQVPIAAEQARKRNSQRDQLLRKKIDLEISKKTNTPRSAKRQAKMATVNTLNVSPAITAQETCTVFEVAQIMAAKRADSVLVVDEDLALTGIFTDKDLAYRVIAENLDVRTTQVSSIMTRNPKCVFENTTATTALHTMVSGGFRHLPVISEASGEILGILDIAKCLREAMEKMERAFGTSKMLTEALSGIEKEWSVHTEDINRCVDFLKDRMGCPDLTTLMDNPAKVPQMSGRSNVREAARLMKATHETAVLITEQGKVTGIFTSKDVVLRTVAVGFDPATTSLFRVMTPHPDCASVSLTIIEALRKMHGWFHVLLLSMIFTNAGC